MLCALFAAPLCQALCLDTALAAEHATPAVQADVPCDHHQMVVDAEEAADADPCCADHADPVLAKSIQLADADMPAAAASWPNVFAATRTSAVTFELHRERGPPGPTLLLTQRFRE